MKQAKMLILIKNVDIELLQRLQEVIAEHNAEKSKTLHEKIKEA